MRNSTGDSMITIPELGIEYMEFIVTVPVNGHRREGKARILSTLQEVRHYLEWAESDDEHMARLNNPDIPYVELHYTYHFVFRARTTHIHFNVIWIDIRKYYRLIEEEYYEDFPLPPTN